MPPSPLRRLVLTSAAAVLALGLLAGCTGQQTPSGYGAGVEEDFVDGCTTRMKDDDANIDDVEDKCTCAYEALADDVPWSEFKQVNSDQIDKPAPLPASFTKVYEDCFPGVDIVSAGAKDSDSSSSSN